MRRIPNNRPCWICKGQPTYTNDKHGIVCLECERKLEEGADWKTIIIKDDRQREVESDSEAVD